ncbi:pseudouridine-5'-phosphate glycosidase, partial [Staphylococcus aureus]|nr:pseudouridine-5'-phosphate glycosidase [Staphylococcus aureus]
RGVEHTMDISADLEELGQTNVTVICAGAKSILDLPKTLEYLETKGVPVIGYQTEELPAFFTPESGIKLNSSANSPETIAQICKAKNDLA